MKLRKIYEELKDAIRVSKDRYYEIFKNPTPRELDDVKSEDLGVRYIINFKDEEVYVFNEDLLHDAASRKLGVKYSFPNWDNDEYAFGIGFVFNGKVRISLEGMDTNVNRKIEIKKGKHPWVSKYISLMAPRVR